MMRCPLSKAFCSFSFLSLSPCFLACEGYRKGHLSQGVLCRWVHLRALEAILGGMGWAARLYFSLLLSPLVPCLSLFLCHSGYALLPLSQLFLL